MPLYEYQCDACGHRFERIQKFSDPLVSECPRCGGTVQKQVSSPAFQFKGSGWYITDYARKSESAKGDKGDKGEGGGESKEAAKDSAPKDAGGKESSAKPSSTEGGAGPTTKPTS
jgi:putative FmdB family regulatory protein